jgi:hypothetical protein
MLRLAQFFAELDDDINIQIGIVIQHATDRCGSNPNAVICPNIRHV